MSFVDYGTEFQEDLAQLILEDRAFSEQIQEVLEIKYFELSHLRYFTKKIFAHKSKFSTHPTKSALPVMFSDLSSLSKLDAEMMTDFLEKVTTKKVREPEFIMETALEFCKKRKVQEAMVKCVDHLESMNFEDIRKEMGEALNLGLDKNVGYEYIKDFEDRYMQKARNPISTGWKQMDQILQGGHGRGELGVVIAPTGAGKSHVLVHLAAEAFKQGMTAVYYTLELSCEAVGRRFDSTLTGVPLDQLNENKEFVLEKVSQFDGKLIIKDYPMRVGTVSMMKAHLTKLQSMGIKPDLIVIDYADLLKAGRNLGEKRFEIEETYEELRGLAKEWNAALYTASQTNRNGLEAEVVTHASIAEAFQKCFPADFIFTLSRTSTDKVENTGRFFIAKNRNGHDGIVYSIKMMPEIVYIEVLSEESQEDIKNKSIKDVKKRIAEIARN